MNRLCLLPLLFVPLHAQDWPMYLQDLSHSSFNRAETQLSPKNIAALQPAWTLDAGSALASAPSLANGVVYFGSWDGNFSAADAKSGSLLWRKFVGIAPDPPSSDCQPGIGVTSQSTVLGTTVYVGGGDSAVYALNARNGSQIWRVPLADPESGAYLWSSIMPYRNALYVGVASLGDCPLVPGALARIDLANPQQPLLHYLTAPDVLGAGVWSTPAIDPSTNTIFLNTGNGDDQDAGTGSFTEAMLALNASTLEIKDYFFLPAQEATADFDWGSSPTLFTLSSGEPMLAATAKDGLLYAFRRSDLGLAWTARLAVGCVSPEDGCGSISTPAFDGATLFVGAGVRDPNGFALGSLYAINPADGSVIWYRDLDGIVIAPVTVSNGLVFVSSTQGLRIYDAPTGQAVWDDNHAGPLYSQPVVSSGRVFSTYLSGKLIAWSLPTLGPQTLYSYNAASGIASAARGTIVTSYGTNLEDAGVTLVDSAGAEWAANLFYALPRQISYVVPDQAAAGRATVKVTAADGSTSTGAIEISDVAPGLFSANSDGKGVAAAQAVLIRANGTQTSLSVLQCGSSSGSCSALPIDLGTASDQVILTLYGTGLRGAASLDKFHCTIGGVPAVVRYAGAQDSPGLDQVNVQIPASLRGRGEVAIQLSVEGQLANRVTISIK